MCVPQLKTPSRFHYKLWSWVSISIYLIECLILIQKNSIFEFLYEYCTRYICTGCMLNPFSCALPPSFALGVQLLIVSKVLSLPRHKPWKWIYNPRSTANKKDFQPGRFGQLLKRNMSSNMWHSGCTRCSTGRPLRSNTLASGRNHPCLVLLFGRNHPCLVGIIHVWSFLVIYAWRTGSFFCRVGQTPLVGIVVACTWYTFAPSISLNPTKQWNLKLRTTIWLESNEWYVR